MEQNIKFTHNRKSMKIPFVIYADKNFYLNNTRV